jgi:hypothetical protein
MSTAAALTAGDDLIPVLQPAEWFGSGLRLLSRPLAAPTLAAGPAAPPSVVLAFADDEMVIFPQAAELAPASWEALEETAIANLHRRYPPRWEFQTDDGGALCLGLVEGRFAASFARDARLLRQAHARFGLSRLFVGVPGHNRLLVTSGLPFAAEPFAELVRDLYDLADSPVSPQVFLSLDGRVAGPLDIPAAG